MNYLRVHYFFVVFCCLSSPSVASIGDTSLYQIKCVQTCNSMTCEGESLITFENNQPIYEKYLGWTCLGECEYGCMWRTVDHFLKMKRRVPQFRGKWPFIRLYGVQEPASALASLLNLCPHIYLISKFRSQVDPSAPMYSVWTLYALISVNTWTWSTIFHTKDNDFTEKMDYLSAFSIVTYSLLAFILKVYCGKKTLASVSLIALCVAFFLQHLYYMGVVHFDYGYNMKANIGIGAVNSICWLAWAAARWNTEVHVKSGALAILLLNCSILLEVLDFPPLWWILDSHALWHFSTAPIHFLWYKFITEDSKRLAIMNNKEKTYLKLA